MVFVGGMNLPSGLLFRSESYHYTAKTIGLFIVKRTVGYETSKTVVGTWQAEGEDRKAGHEGREGREENKKSEGKGNETTERREWPQRRQERPRKPPFQPRTPREWIRQAQTRQEPT